MRLLHFSLTLFILNKYNCRIIDVNLIVGNAVNLLNRTRGSEISPEVKNTIMRLNALTDDEINGLMDDTQTSDSELVDITARLQNIIRSGKFVSDGDPEYGALLYASNDLRLYLIRHHERLHEAPISSPTEVPYSRWPLNRKKICIAHYSNEFTWL